MLQRQICLSGDALQSLVKTGNHEYPIMTRIQEGTVDPKLKGKKAEEALAASWVNKVVGHLKVCAEVLCIDRGTANNHVRKSMMEVAEGKEALKRARKEAKKQEKQQQQTEKAERAALMAAQNRQPFADDASVGTYLTDDDGEGLPWQLEASDTVQFREGEVGYGMPMSPMRDPHHQDLSSTDIGGQLIVGGHVGPKSPSAYEKLLDPRTGKYYYLHKESGETTWDKPPGDLRMPLTQKQMDLQARIKSASAATVAKIHHIRTTIVDKGKAIAVQEERVRNLAAVEKTKKAERLIWHEALIEAIELKGEINLAWKPLPTVDAAVFSFEHDYGVRMRALRLVGLGLTELPIEIFTNLLNLEVLSLTSNKVAHTHPLCIPLSHPISSPTPAFLQQSSPYTATPSDAFLSAALAARASG